MRSRSGTSTRRALMLARDPLGIKPLFFTEQRAAWPSRRRLRRFVSCRIIVSILTRTASTISSASATHCRPARSSSRCSRWSPAMCCIVGDGRRTGHPPVLGGAAQGRGRTCEADWIERTRAELLRTVKEHHAVGRAGRRVRLGRRGFGAIAAAMARTSSAAVQDVHRRLSRLTARRDGGGQTDRATSGLRARRAADAAADCSRRASGGAGVFRRADRGQQRDTALVLSRAAAEHVKVVLCGEGGDELFLGYNRQRWAQADGAVAPSAPGWRARSSVCPAARSASGITCASSPADFAKAPRSKTATSASSLRFRSARRSCARRYTSRNSSRRERAASSSRRAPRPSSPRRAAAAVRPRRVHAGRSDRPHDRVHVPAARPREHGAFARGAGAVPVPSLRRVRARPCRPASS